MKKRIVAMFLAVCFVVTLLPTAAFAAGGDVVDNGDCGATGNESGITWKVIDNGDTTYTLNISGRGEMADYAKAADVPWNQYMNNITKGIVEKGITHLGARTFVLAGKLESVELPEGLETIGASCFNQSGLTSIQFPSTLREIGTYAFYRGKLAGKVVLPDSMTKIDAHAFSGSQITDIVLPQNLETLGSGALAETNLTSVPEIPEKITSLDAMFMKCPIVNAVIPAHVTSITRVFMNCTSLETVDIESNSSDFDGANVNPAQGTFSGCTNLKSVTLSDSITKIGVGTFSGCTSLKDTAFLSNIESIGTAAFSGSGVEGTLVLNATSIGDRAFDKCTDLGPDIVLNKVAAIGENAFRNDTNLSGVKYVQEGQTVNKFPYSTTTAYLNGGTFDADTEFEAGKLATPEKEGCKFGGWYENADFSGDKAETAEQGKTYYAKYTPKVKSGITVVGVVGEGEEVNGSLPDAYEEDVVTLTDTFDGIPEGKIVSGWEVVEPAGLTIENNRFVMPAQSVTLRAVLADPPVDEPVDPADGGFAGSDAAMILGGAALGAATYFVGTQIWMELNLPGGVIPTSREQLALMLWNAAGRPQPAVTALYADISAEAAEPQLAARWCVEQGLMKDYGENFQPGRYTFRPQVIMAWNELQKLNGQISA